MDSTGHWRPAFDHGGVDARTSFVVPPDAARERSATVVEFDPPMMQRLRVAYRDAREAGARQFEFDGHRISTRYARWLLRYLTNTFGPGVVMSVRKRLPHNGNGPGLPRVTSHDAE